MSPLRPADIFLIQSAMERYQKKFPHEPTPSAEVALAWLANKNSGAPVQQPSPSNEGGLFSRVLGNILVLFRPLGSTPR